MSNGESVDKRADGSVVTGGVVKGTVQISSTQVIQYMIFAGFYVAVTKTHALTEADMGVISVLAFIAQAMFVLTSFSLPSALAKFVSENVEKGLPERAAAIQKTINRSAIILFTIGYATLIVLSPQISRLFWNTDSNALLIVLMCIYAFFHALIHLYNRSLQALRLFGKMAVVTLLWVALSRVLGASLAFLNFGIYGVLMGYVIGFGIACGASMLFARGRLPNSKSYYPLKPLIVFSFPLFLGNLTNLILNWADIIFVTSLTADYAKVGVYYMAVESALFLSALWLPITHTIFPLLSGRHGLKDFHGVTEIVKTTIRYLVYLIVPCCVGLAFLAPTALRFLYAEEYAAGAASLAILSLAQILMSIYFVLITALTAIGKTTSVFKVNVFSVLAYIALLLFLVPPLQATGAATARLGLQIVGFSAALYMLGRHIRVRFDSEALWKSVVSSLAMLPVLLLIQHLTTGFPVHYVMVTEIAAGLGSYVLFLYILKAFNHQDFELLREAFPSLKRYIRITEKIMSR